MASKDTVVKETKVTTTRAERVKKFYNELVTIKLFKDNNRYKDDVFVAVNGVGMLVPRGVEVKIPRKYAEALKNSEKQRNFAIEYQAKLQSESALAE